MQRSAYAWAVCVCVCVLKKACARGLWEYHVETVWECHVSSQCELHSCAPSCLPQSRSPAPYHRLHILSVHGNSTHILSLINSLEKWANSPSKCKNIFHSIRNRWVTIDYCTNHKSVSIKMQNLWLFLNQFKHKLCFIWQRTCKIGVKKCWFIWKRITMN